MGNAKVQTEWQWVQSEAGDGVQELEGPWGASPGEEVAWDSG